jgi:hypothetical protein
MQTTDPVQGTAHRRNLYERRANAARRAITAIDRFSLTMSSASTEEHVRALRWIYLWIDFAMEDSYAPGPRHHQRRRQLHIDHGDVAADGS